MVVEDNNADVFLIREAIVSWQIDASLHFEYDGERAIQFLERIDNDPELECPDLLIIDLNLPKRKGGEVLQFARLATRFCDIPVLIVTSSDSARDRDEMTRLGCNAYFRKPSSYQEFMQLGSVVKNLLHA